MLSRIKTPVKTTKSSPLREAVEGAVPTTCLAPTACFVAGTLIHTSSSPKPIETFVGGEQVCSRDANSREPGLRMVIATKATPQQPICEVVIADLWGGKETLLTTAEHPFWVTNVSCSPAEAGGADTRAQWLRAASLAPGMRLINLRGQAVTVQSRRETGHKATVYNLEVREHHTYHVGELGTWVHDGGCFGPSSQAV